MGVKNIWRELFDLLCKKALKFWGAGAVGNSVCSDDGNAASLALGDQRGILGENDAVFKSFEICLFEKVSEKPSGSSDIRIGKYMRYFNFS